ncbi:DegT/DnrJ/EryC1/StrS aminotransferase family protein [Candidatus Woesearchaeota archaeon]|nr:DegT/DnrJ/EryC1/StrS aminotransferase family protein [Candidatus Woesearchaeota archaeon]
MKAKARGKKRNIPYFKPTIEKEEIDEVVNALKSGWVTTGPRTKKFEEKFKKYIGSKHAVAVSSCTAALHVGLVVAGVKEGDEVITTPYTFAATAEVICYLKAKPVFVDIKEDTYNIDADKIEEKITSRTKAILPVHYGGQPCDMDKILAIAKKHSLKVIEDAAHAVGAEYKGKKIGLFGDVTAFSFYATKNMTTGEGGMATFENDEYADKMQVLSLHGLSQDAWKRYSAEGSWYYEIIMAGYKYNMTDIQAALGLCQLKKLERFNKRRERLAEMYNQEFSKIKELSLRKIKDGVKNVWHLYTIRIDESKLRINRNQFIKELAKKGISTSVHFIPLHLHPYYQQKHGHKKGDFPVAEKVYSNLISLPLYPDLGEDDVNYIIDSVKEIIKQNQRF